MVVMAACRNSLHRFLVCYERPKYRVSITVAAGCDLRLGRSKMVWHVKQLRLYLYSARIHAAWTRVEPWSTVGKGPRAPGVLSISRRQLVRSCAH